MAEKPRIFARDYRVRVDDINYGGHMGNERALVIFQDARLAFLESLGRSERDLDEGAGVILVEANVKFLKEVRLHDELLTEVAVSGLQRSSFDVLFRTKRAGDAEPALTGMTRMLPYDYAAKKVRRISDALRAAFEPYVVKGDWLNPDHRS